MLDKNFRLGAQCMANGSNPLIVRLKFEVDELNVFKKEALELLKILEKDTHPDEYGIGKFLSKYGEIK